MKIFYLLPLIGFMSCGSDSANLNYSAQENTSGLICDCYQNEHEIVGIDFYKEINAYKEYIAKVSSTHDNNFSKSLLTNYEEMENDTFLAKPADTVFQKGFLESIDVSLVQKCIVKYAEDKVIAGLIQRLDQVGLSASFSTVEQLDILKALEMEMINTSNVTWVEPLELNAFFYMYDRYNKEASKVKIEVLKDVLLPSPPVPVPIEVLPPIEEEIEEE